MRKYIHTQGLVIKRHNYGEADRFVTLLTRDYGKISGLAKGVRRLSSRKRTALEPFNQVKLSMIETVKGFVIVEASVESTFATVKQSLPKLAQATQFIEIVEGLVAESEIHVWLYHQTLAVLKSIDSGECDRNTQLVAIREILVELGFGAPDEDETKLKNHIEEITQRRLKSKQFYLGIVS